MKFHPFADVFPLIEGAELATLVEDIKAFGLREKIWLYQGKILDGRNRFLACQKAKAKPTYRTYKGSDAGALALVVSANIQRRHLTDAQRAMAAARIATLRKGGGSNAPRGALTQEEAADRMDVSRRSVQRARKIIEQGSKALQGAVESGEVPLQKAAAVVELPKSEQLAAATAKPEKEEESEVPDFSVTEFDENDDAIIAQKEREYQDAIEKVMDSDDKLATANKEIARLSGLVAVLTKARDQYMASHGEAVRFIKRQQREIDKLRKALDRHEPERRARMNGTSAHA